MAVLSNFLVVFLSFFSFLSIVNGTPQFTNCPSPGSVCLSQSVSYECSVDTTGGADTLRWEVYDATNSQIGVVAFSQGQTLPAMAPIGTDFTVNLTDSSGPIVSVVTFTPSLSISSYTVECEARGTGSFTPVTCPISIADIPAAPDPNDPNFTTNTLNFSWSPSTDCLSHYSVNVTSIEYTINTTDTSLSLPVPSTNDTEYSISVVAVDTGGRYMDSQEKRFIPDVPQNVTNVVLRQTYPDDDDDDDDDTVNITVSWNERPSSSRPNVSDYIIYPNVTDPDTNITISNSTTTHNIPDATVGSVYTVGVAAINVLGTGPIVSATIRIISTSVPSPPTSTSMSMTVTPSVTSSPPVTSTITSTQSTPATTPPTSSPSAGGLGVAVYIGIGVGVAVIVIVILILIIVGYLVWRKSKGEKANFDQRRDSTEPIALVDKKDHGSSPATGQPIYQEAMSSEDIQREAAPTTGELYAQPTKGSTRRPPPQPQPELATYQDPSTIQRTQAPTMEYLYAEVDKSKPQQQQAVYAQVDKEKKGGDGTLYADLDLKTTQGGPVAGNNPSNVIYSDVHNN